MKHPTSEELISFAYGEVPEPIKGEMTAHLKVCQQCEGQIERWRSIMSALNSSNIASASSRKPQPHSVLKWAIAAVFVLGIGFALGRSAVASPNLEEVRADIEQSLRASLKQEMIADLRSELELLAGKTLAASLEQSEKLLEAYDAQRQQEQRTTLAAIKNVEARIGKQAANLETVALFTEASLRTAQQQIVQLATYPEATAKGPSQIHEPNVR